MNWNRQSNYVLKSEKPFSKDVDRLGFWGNRVIAEE